MNDLSVARAGTEALKFFCRHLVGLCLSIKDNNDNEDQPDRFEVISGTLIEIQDQVFYLTAGHILKDLEAALRSSEPSITNSILADIFSLGCISDRPTPFDLRHAKLAYIDDAELGLDFGVIYLEPHYVRLLDKNGLVALTEENWAHQHTVSFDAHQMLGFPEEFTSKTVSSFGEGQVAPTMFAVERLETAPIGTVETHYPRFIGQLNQALPINSVTGMSGGPIFGFRFEPPTQYWIVALQSTWLAKKRIVFGCPLPIIGSLLLDILRKQSTDTIS